MKKRRCSGKPGNLVTSPQTLVDTMIFMNGIYFALRRGGEHRNLRHDPPQAELIEKPGERA